MYLTISGPDLKALGLEAQSRMLLGVSVPEPACICVVQVPVVGIMAEGGGARAMTSLFGHLLALQKLGLLDCVTYLSGISGATW